MAFDPSRFTLSAFPGTLIGKPVQICTTQAHQSKTVVINQDWANPIYGGNPNVQININQGTTNPLDKIIGCYIDNSRCNDDIVLYFPDTTYSIPVPGLTTRFAPVFTQTGICNLYKPLGNLQFPDGSHKQTQVILCNFLTDSFGLDSTIPRTVDLWQRSEGVDGTPDLIIPTVGDTNVSFILTLQVAHGGQIVVAPAAAGQQFIITNLQIAIYRAFNTASASSGNIGLASNFKDVPVRVSTNLDYYPYTILFSQSDEYIIIDGTIGIQVFNNFVMDAGNAHFLFDYSLIAAQ